MAKLSVSIVSEEKEVVAVVNATKDRKIETLPEGKHNFIILESDIKTSKKGEDYLSLTIEVEGGEYAGLVSSHRYCIYHSSETVAKYAMINLRALLKIVKIDALSDTEELVGKRFGGFVGKQKNNDAFTEIKYVYASGNTNNVNVNVNVNNVNNVKKADNVNNVKKADVLDEEIPLTDEDIKAAQDYAEKFMLKEENRKKEEAAALAESIKVREEAARVVDARITADIAKKAEDSKTAARRIAPPPWVSKF
jgi:hypothetical protein